MRNMNTKNEKCNNNVITKKSETCDIHCLYLKNLRKQRIDINEIISEQYKEIKVLKRIRGNLNKYCNELINKIIEHNEKCSNPKIDIID